MREIPEPEGIRRARTLPALWYSAEDHFQRELQQVWRQQWVCVGDEVDMPAPGAWKACTVAGLPTLLVRDRDGELRAFLNACRHRAAPLCDVGEEGHGAALTCPYHGWLYRLDGALARARGVGDPDGFDVADFPLKPFGLAHWRRWVFIHADPAATAPAFGPLGDAIAGYPVEAMRVVLQEAHERPFNWKVLLENYSENYHTPFVHPEIDNSNTHDYPMLLDGLVLYAWDRPLHPVDVTGVRMATLLPGEPGWEQIGSAPTAVPYDVGSYLTVWPNLMLNVFPDASLAMWMEPVAANRTVVHRRLYAHPEAGSASVDAQRDAHRLVHLQDVDICTAVQRTHDAGVDADGVLATVEERGVHFVHQHLRRALGDGGVVSVRRVTSERRVADVFLEDRGK